MPSTKRLPALTARSAMMVLAFLSFLASAVASHAQEAAPEDTAPAAPASTSTAAADAPVSPLAPAPTGSPRETLSSFLRLSEAATRNLIDAFYEEEGDKDATAAGEEELTNLKDQAILDLDRAMSTLDLSNIAPTNRRTVGLDSVLLLEEIFARIPLPDLDTVPGPDDVEEGAAANGWTVPGTQIQMMRSQNLSGNPRYLFSPETITLLPVFYATVRDLPRHTEAQVDFYQHFISAPGLEMPAQLYRYILNLPSWALTVYSGQAVWQWIALAVLTALYGLVGWIILNREVHREARPQGVAVSIYRLIVPLFIIGVLGVFRWLCDNIINLTGNVLTYVELVVESLQTLSLAVLVVFVFNLIAAVVTASPRIRTESLDASLIRLVMRVIGFVAAAFIIFFGATQIGLPIYGIVAGLGVGGLAIALAVRPTLENFIGGIILYADRPVKVGDFCQFGSMLGTVEEIGLRSTKVRSLNRTLVTVQNAEFSQMSITNFSRRDANLMQTVIHLRHETTSEQLRAVIDGITAMLKEDPRVNSETVRICLLDITESSFHIELWAYIRSADFTQFLKIKESLLINVMDLVESHGLAFARPSQTTYLTHDKLTQGSQTVDTSAPFAAPAGAS